MEINITRFFAEACPMDYSASVAEIGQDAGPATWQAALDDAPDYMPLDTPDKIDAFKSYVAGFGAWSPEEINAWSGTKVNALFIQLVSGDIREADLTPESDDADWTAYEERAQAGQCSGRIYRSTNGEIYYELSS